MLHALKDDADKEGVLDEIRTRILLAGIYISYKDDLGAESLNEARTQLELAKVLAKHAGEMSEYYETAISIKEEACNLLA